MNPPHLNRSLMETRLCSSISRNAPWIVALVLAGTAFAAAAQTDVPPVSTPTAHSALTNAFHQHLVPGRAFLKGYPNSVSRNAVVNKFLGIDPSESSQIMPSRTHLKRAIADAVTVRLAEPPEPETFAADRVPPSIQAKVIAWEALESLSTGYLFAGNRDLLNALRVAYPGNVTGNDKRGLPKEERDPFNGTSQKSISYARLYFLQSIKDTLQYIAEDTTGHLRAVGTAYPTMPHYVTFDDEASEMLPHATFDDTNFGGSTVSDREASQSVAFLYGSALERLGFAAVGYADQLWRAAFTGPGVGQKREATEKNRMLARAEEVLRENAHAQFLAVLPLATQLNDGSDGSANTYELARLNQARVSVTDALRLRQLILAGEKPTQTALVSAWHPAAFTNQMKLCKDAKTAVEDQFDRTRDAVAAAEQAQSDNFERELDLRNGIGSQLVEITGLNTSDSRFNDLKNASARREFLSAITNKFDSLINENNPSAPGLHDGSLMSIQALRLMQAIQEAKAKRAEVDGYAQRMSIELKRFGDESATITVNGIAYGAIEMALGLASATPDISICACGLSSGTITHSAPSKALIAIEHAARAVRVASENVAINAINSQAVIRNLLIDQQIAREELGAVHLNVAIAGGELRQLLNRANRLVEDHIFYQDGSKDLWYRDPSLMFKAEAAEEKYQELLQEYRIHLYKLARMVEAAWTERFSNPVKKAEAGSIEPLNNGSFDEFTEAESIFGVGNHVQATAFFSALQTWDTLLRTPDFRGANNPTKRDANSFQGQPFSLRRDIFKLIDYRYDRVANRYVKDPDLERRSIQRFRAILLDLAHRDPRNRESLSRLRIDFPLTYNQARVVFGQANPAALVLRNIPGGAGSLDQFWNHRITQMGFKIVGTNVFAAGTSVPVAFELFGTAERIGFFADSLFTASRTVSTFQIPLYQRDPDARLGEPAFGDSNLSAAIGNGGITLHPIAGWPLFCDRFVLRVGALSTLRIENIEDIELHIKMEVGSPPPIPW